MTSRLSNDDRACGRRQPAAANEPVDVATRARPATASARP